MQSQHYHLWNKAKDAHSVLGVLSNPQVAMSVEILSLKICFSYLRTSIQHWTPVLSSPQAALPIII